MRHMHHHIRAVVLFHLIALVSITGFMLLSGCGGDPNQRNKTLTAELATINAARDGWGVWDREHEHQIVASSKTREEAEARVAEYRKAADLIYAAFEAAYKLLAVAATQADDASLRAAVEAAFQAIEKAKKLTGGP